VGAFLAGVRTAARELAELLGFLASTVVDWSERCAGWVAVSPPGVLAARGGPVE
jgi:hypothetical protein